MKIDKKLYAKWKKEKSRKAIESEWFNMAYEHGVCPYCVKKLKIIRGCQGMSSIAECSKHGVIDPYYCGYEE